MRWLDGITNSMDLNLSKLQERTPLKDSRTGNPGVLQCTRSQRVGHNLVTEQQQREVSMPLPGYFIFLNLFLAVLDLHCCLQAFSSCSEWGFSCFRAQALGTWAR